MEFQICPFAKREKINHTQQKQIKQPRFLYMCVLCKALCAKGMQNTRAYCKR